MFSRSNSAEQLLVPCRYVMLELFGDLPRLLIFQVLFNSCLHMVACSLSSAERGRGVAAGDRQSPESTRLQSNRLCLPFLFCVNCVVFAGQRPPHVRVVSAWPPRTVRPPRRKRRKLLASIIALSQQCCSFRSLSVVPFICLLWCLLLPQPVCLGPCPVRSIIHPSQVRRSALRAESLHAGPCLRGRVLRRLRTLNRHPNER